MLDLAEEVIIPAFFDTSLERDFSTTKYFFHRVELVTIQSGTTPILAIAGRLVKDTEVVSRQYYSRTDRSLRSQNISIPNAPSAFFVLLLHNHRVLYLRETNDAPVAKTFGTTCKIFIKKKFNQFLQAEHQRRKQEGGQISTHKAIKGEYSPVSVDFFPKTSSEQVEDFLNDFGVIQAVNLSFVKPNGADFEGFIDEHIQEQVKLNAPQHNVTYGNQLGLSREPAKEIIKESLKSESVEVKFRGLSRAGQRLFGENETVKMAVPYPDSTLGVESNTTVARSLHEFARDYVPDEPLSSKSESIRERRKSLS